VRSPDLASFSTRFASSAAGLLVSGVLAFKNGRQRPIRCAPQGRGRLYRAMTVMLPVSGLAGSMTITL